MWKWLHHLFSPHCSECELKELELREYEEKLRACRTCQVFEMEVARLRADNERLLNLVLNGNKVETVSTNNSESTEPLRPINSTIGWRTRKRLLQDESREQARILHKQREDLISAGTNTEKLEEALKVEIPEQVEQNA